MHAESELVQYCPEVHLSRFVFEVHCDPEVQPDWLVHPVVPLVQLPNVQLAWSVQFTPLPALVQSADCVQPPLLPDVWGLNTRLTMRNLLRVVVVSTVPPMCTPAFIPLSLSHAMWRWRDISRTEELGAEWKTTVPACANDEVRSIMAQADIMQRDHLGNFNFKSDMIFSLFCRACMIAASSRLDGPISATPHSPQLGTVPKTSGHVGKLALSIITSLHFLLSSALRASPFDLQLNSAAIGDRRHYRARNSRDLARCALPPLHLRLSSQRTLAGQQQATQPARLPIYL